MKTVAMEPWKAVRAAALAASRASAAALAASSDMASALSRSLNMRSYRRRTLEAGLLSSPSCPASLRSSS